MRLAYFSRGYFRAYSSRKYHYHDISQPLFFAAYFSRSVRPAYFSRPRFLAYPSRKYYHNKVNRFPTRLGISSGLQKGYAWIPKRPMSWRTLCPEPLIRVQGHVEVRPSPSCTDPHPPRACANHTHVCMCACRGRRGIEGPDTRQVKEG